MIQSHEALMVECQQGDLRSFELLVETYRNKVFNFLYRMVNRDASLAEDLLQEVFMKAYHARLSYEPSARFATWLLTIARNHCLNCLKSRRYRQNQQTLSLDVETQCLEAQADLSGKLDPASALTQRETAEILEFAIDRLPDAYKECFVLHAVEGVAHQEIALILQENASTVRSNYHRARQMLREHIGHVITGEGRLV